MAVAAAEGAAERFDQARTLCQDAGFRRITFRGDTDFSQTRHLDRWDAAGVRFVFGYDARANLIGIADALPAGAWTPLVRRAPDEVATEPRARPMNVKAATIVEREYTNLRLESEAVAEFSYQPTACCALAICAVGGRIQGPGSYQGPSVNIDQPDQPR